MKEERCKQCDEELAVCARGLPESHGGSQGGEHWQYVLSVLIPLAGIIMGCLYLGRGEEEKGKNLLILSLILAPVFSLLLFFLLSFPGF